MYGPVQDVRIPYQQKRMFGFVTFVYPETVKLILAKGNPHFVCDARVLVKPYKEKGKVPDKYRHSLFFTLFLLCFFTLFLLCFFGISRKIFDLFYRKLQQIDRDFSPCGTPTGLDSRELYDHLQLGSRMFYNSQQDLLLRRKLEKQQADIDLQSRRLLNLQLLDVKKNQLPHPYNHHRAFSPGSPIPSPTHSPNPFAQNLIFPTIRSASSCSNSDILRGEVHNQSPSMNQSLISFYVTELCLQRMALRHCPLRSYLQPICLGSYRRRQTNSQLSMTRRHPRMMTLIYLNGNNNKPFTLYSNLDIPIHYSDYVL